MASYSSEDDDSRAEDPTSDDQVKGSAAMSAFQKAAAANFGVQGGSHIFEAIDNLQTLERTRSLSKERVPAEEDDDDPRPLPSAVLMTPKTRRPKQSFVRRVSAWAPKRFMKKMSFKVPSPSSNRRSVGSNASSNASQPSPSPANNARTLDPCVRFDFSKDPFAERKNLKESVRALTDGEVDNIRNGSFGRSGERTPLEALDEVENVAFQGLLNVQGEIKVGDHDRVANAAEALAATLADSGAAKLLSSLTKLTRAYRGRKGKRKTAELLEMAITKTSKEAWRIRNAKLDARAKDPFKEMSIPSEE